MNGPPPVSTLALRHAIPHPLAIEQWAEVRPLIDGRDVLAEIHPEGVASCSRRWWFGPANEWPLAASAEPRRVELSNNDCCGGIFVTIHRQADRVVWSSWQNTNDIRVPVPPDVHFDAAQCDAELARAVADTGWEEPVDTVARLVTPGVADGDWFQRWDCVLDQVELRREVPEGVEVYFSRRGGVRAHGSELAFDLPLTLHEPVEEQARRFIELIMAEDPRKIADPL
ncbi:hypothetical protein E2C00_18090 [Streptomyces sp. WAC05374]|uniref:hypothetical protein n=1 Tax=Streptomyces sp. WAC05374 TaxID=2487420 RepID=UPI000F88D5D2|nr:hypothetical protein [Streptomyces sp. WAC05374]RST14150.1 hypothetical protein EF905_18255 [Streptomyces sp. WAC05374]TDF54792.1 hypothetical protein E2C00_18090 [Streptomyces sp. WAC05374]TDF56428.1 hypothetical protein E2C02_13545 [Streptomyces sp. WAC05374]